MSTKCPAALSFEDKPKHTLRSASAQTAAAIIATELTFRHSVIQTQAAGIAQSVQ